MGDQMYRRHTNATALSSSPVVSALGSESDNPGKIMRALLLGLAKYVIFNYVNFNYLHFTVASYKVYTAVLKAKSS